jgi:hypothetical protein
MHTHQRFLTVLGIIGLVGGGLAASLAAQGPTRDTATVYQLAQVGGKALPVEVEKGFRCREEVTGGKLTLAQDGRWLLETSQREHCGDRATDELDTDDGRYTTEGQTLRFFDDDGKENTKDWSIGKDIDLDDLHSGTLGADGALTVLLADEKTTLVFRR